MNDVTQPAKRRITMPSVAATIVALVALLAFAPLASATSDPLASGTTTVTLNKGLFKKLKKSGVKVLKVSPGTVKNRTVTLPVSGGSVDPTTGQGTIEQSGGIKFKAGKRTAQVNTLVLDTTTSALNGKVAGKTMKFASVTGVTVVRNGFGVNVNIGKLKLTGKAAKQLNKKLGFTGKKGKGKSSKRASVSKTTQPPFKGNQVLGSSTSETQPSTVSVLASGNATLNPALETLGKFVGLKITPAPIAPASGSLAPPAFFFPISGGTISPTGTAGTVQTAGGVALIQEKGPTILLTNVWVDFTAKTATTEVDIEPSPPLPGKLGRSSIASLDLTGATISSDPAARTVTVTGAKALLQEVTAEVLNEVFAEKKQVFKAGDSLGTFSFTVQTQ